MAGKKPTSEEAVLNLLVSRLDSFERSITAMDGKVDNLVVITAKQEENVKEHMRRSDALERRQDKTDADSQKRDELLSAKLAPIEAHVKWVGTTFKVIGVIAGLAVTCLTLVKLYLEIVKLTN